MWENNIQLYEALLIYDPKAQTLKKSFNKFDHVLSVKHQEQLERKSKDTRNLYAYSCKRISIRHI